jgi:trehalose 6-phosphate phosphatase
LQQRPDRTGLFLDFDGSLSEIVERPELARPIDGAPELLERLASSYALVAVVSGRPGAEVERLLGTPSVPVFGLYGYESVDPSPAALEAVRRATADVMGVSERIKGIRVEGKGRSVAVHFRESPDPPLAEATLGPPLAAIAARHHLAVAPGKMVLELVPSDLPGKGAVILAEGRRLGLEACLYAGDDRADLNAFEALEKLRREGLHTVAVAVRSEETPEELIARADVVVDRPAGLLELLGRL